MFDGCTSLTQAPELPATILASSCYREMFRKCNNLSYVKMMGLLYNNGDSMSDYTDGWLFDVAANGTFVKNAAANWDEDGIIPKGWKVETATK
jgi:hypothetical protein